MVHPRPIAAKFPMRVFHTADWHLGQDFHGFDRAHEHRAFLDWLSDTLVAAQADALVIAGDIYDSQNPSSAAQRLLFDFIAGTKRRLPDLDIVITGGNHDSAGRLEAPSPLLHALGVHVVGSLPRGGANGDGDGGLDPDRLLIPLSDRNGREAVLCCAVPFLRAGDLPPLTAASDPLIDPLPAPLPDPLIEGVRQIYAQALAQAAVRRRPGQALLVTGHCYMTGGAVSELSERRILGGNQHALPADIFGDTASYVALGHLHKPQRVGGTEHIRYAGSPFPMSSSERHYKHQVLQLDFAGAGAPAVTSLPVPRPVPLLRVPETGFAPLSQILAQLAALALPEADKPWQPYLEVAVTLDGPTPGLMRDINGALEGKPVRLVRVDRQITGSDDDGAQPLRDLCDLHPEEVFHQCWARRYPDAPPDAIVTAFRQLLESVEQAERP